MGRRSILKPALKQMEAGEHLTIEDRLISEYDDGAGFGKLCNLIESETGTKISPPTLREYLKGYGLKTDPTRKRRKQTREETIKEFRRKAPRIYAPRLTHDNEQCKATECPVCPLCSIIECKVECQDKRIIDTEESLNL